jgi:predicted ATPase/DNA-binding SARP family transcriptional activator
LAHLTLRVLGPLIATGENGDAATLPYDKVRALLAYLAIEQSRPHSRARLAALFWPEHPESAARHSLSQALSTLRARLGDGIVLADRQTVQLNPAFAPGVDFLEFRALLDGGSATTDRLRDAISLYRGPFLEGLSLGDCPEFEDWMRTVQESASRLYADALRSLIDRLAESGELNEACDLARTLIDFDPWDEDSHRLAMRLLARNGRRPAAIRQYELCVETLRRDLDLEPEPETERLAERIRSGLEGPADEAQLSDATHPDPPTLPAPVSPIIARETEVAAITDLIQQGGHRLVTLVGPGGIGKSRLSLEVARTLESEFADGVSYISLAGVASANLIAPTILSAVAAQVDPHDDPAEQLMGFLSRRQMLLTLDNFEHLLDGGTLLHDALERAPGLRILVTSRERLSLSGETVYEIEGLSLPERADSQSVASAGASRLFMARARSHQASFLPRPEDSPAIARIAHLSGGMPLAIELAAAWIPVLTPNEIADEIEQSLDFLHTSLRDVPERHRSVRAVLDRSWDNLSEVEQRAFRRLSVFPGGFTRESAWYVTGASLPVLSALVSKSLVRHTRHGRYEIHELLRQYGAEQLAESFEEAEIVRDRFRDFFIGFLTVREEQLQGRQQTKVLPELDVEIENLRAAWRRAAVTSDFPGLSRAAHGFWLFFEITGRYREGVDVMRLALDSLLAIEDEAARQSRDYRMALARVRSRWASLGFRMYGPRVLGDQVRQALELIRDLDEPREQGMLLNYLSVSSHALGDFDSEAEQLAASIERFERSGDRWGLAYSMNDLGFVLGLRGEYESARDHHRKALATLEEIGDRRGIAFALRNLGIVARRAGDDDMAFELLRRSVDVRRSIGNEWGVADSMNQIGVLLRDDGDPDAADGYFREALAIARDLRAMQLASEILREYRAIAPREFLVASQIDFEALGAAGDSTGPDADRVARLVDTVLETDAGASASSG